MDLQQLKIDFFTIGLSYDFYGLDIVNISTKKRLVHYYLSDGKRESWKLIYYLFILHKYYSKLYNYEKFN